MFPKDFLVCSLQFCVLPTSSYIPTFKWIFLHRTHVNISFTQYLNELRIAYAIGLLNEGDTISNISKKCGYKSRTSFYYNFEKVMNISISDYKSQVMGSQKDAEL